MRIGFLLTAYDHFFAETEEHTVIEQCSFYVRVRVLKYLWEL